MGTEKGLPAKAAGEKHQACTFMLLVASRMALLSLWALTSSGLYSFTRSMRERSLRYCSILVSLNSGLADTTDGEKVPLGAT